MELKLAQNLAVSLMKKHGLLDKGWCFEFDNSVKRFGVCKYRSKTIGLSAKLTTLNNEEKVKDTILHEIAHAIAGFSAGHGIEWKRVCIQIGAKPERCYDSTDTNMPTMKYQAVCGGCGRVHQKARIKHKEVRRSCKCQSHKSWDNKILLEYKTTY
jgi:predicted SprT family Zn-dependent metalloprotease